MMGALLGLLFGFPIAEASEVDEEAYALNRDGMIAMSEARFDDAIDAFQRAAVLRADYGIVGRPLIYTPLFMTGWASEKIGRTVKACEAYRRFLHFSPLDTAEPTKIDHAASYLASQCDRPPHDDPSTAK